MQAQFTAGAANFSANIGIYRTTNWDAFVWLELNNDADGFASPGDFAWAGRQFPIEQGQPTFDLGILPSGRSIVRTGLPFYVNYQGALAALVPQDWNYYEYGATQEDAYGVEVRAGGSGFAIPGKTFLGWSFLPDGSGKIVRPGTLVRTWDIPSGTPWNNLASTGILNLHAVWANNADCHTVTYHGDGTEQAGQVPQDSTIYLTGNQVTILGNTGGLTRSGWTFVGWTFAATPNEVLSPGASIAVGTNNVDLYAKWVNATTPTYQVTYDPNGATAGVSDQTPLSYEEAQTVTVNYFGAPSRPGYALDGWSTVRDGSVQYQQGDTFPMGASDITLFAHWTAIPYHVTYVGNGNDTGEVPTDSSTYTIGHSVTVQGNPNGLMKMVYTFAGWSTLPSGGTVYQQGDSVPVGSSDIVLYAQWNQTASTVTYDDNGATGGQVPTGSTTYTYGQSVVVLGNTGNLTKGGYDFAGWTHSINGVVYSPGGGGNFTIGVSSVTLTAKWTPISYAVTYSANGSTSGTPPSDATRYTDGVSVTVLGKGDLAKTGSTFAGWSNVPSGGALVSAGTSYAVGAAGLVLYAQWTPLLYTFTYDGNGNTSGSPPAGGSNYTYGQQITVQGNSGGLAKTGYDFAGWGTSAGGGTLYAVGSTYTLGATSATLYAQWTSAHYSLSYDGNGNTSGSVPTDATNYVSGQGATVVSNTGGLVRTGYAFIGWGTSTGGGTAYAAGSTYTFGSTNVTLYAQWATDHGTLTYFGNGNTSGAVPTDATTYTLGQVATVRSNTGGLVRTGYDFAGWGTTSGGGTLYAVGSSYSVATANAALYAQWTPTVNWGVPSSWDGVYSVGPVPVMEVRNGVIYLGAASTGSVAVPGASLSSYTCVFGESECTKT